MSRELVLLPKEKYERLVCNLSTRSNVSSVKENESDANDSCKANLGGNMEIGALDDKSDQQGGGALSEETEEVNDTKENNNDEKPNHQEEENRMDVDENDGATKVVKMYPEVFFFKC